jgi:Flp pilus assembly protein TadB
MTKIVLLAVAAAWAAVLIPPLLRSRLENRPGSSVTDFRRQLSTLQKTVPTRSMAPMRSMARPLAQAPAQRSQVQRSHAVAAGYDRDQAYTGELQRRSDRDAMVAGQRRTPARRVSRREAIRRRRANVLFVLAMVTVLTLFLAATTKSSGMVYAFALSFVSLCGYCYKLAQLRQYERDSQYTDVRWFNAA